MNLSQYKNRFNVVYKKEKIRRISTLLNEVKMSNFRFPIKEDLFFHSKPVLNLTEETHGLQVSVKDNKINKLYLSYQTLDNKFGESPKNSLLNLQAHKKYQFILRIDKEDSVDIVPYIIHYQDGNKRKLTEIKKNKQLIDFQNDSACRLTFKITGNGNFTIKEIIIVPKG